MVYLNLSIIDAEEAIEFYEKLLGVFEAQSISRLIFTLDADLIIDLHECGSESHLEHFETDEHIVSSFWVHVGGQGHGKEIPILSSLKQKNVKYDEVINLGGHYLNFRDPSGNKFTLHAHGNVFK